jgi:hypothetical protein
VRKMPLSVRLHGISSTFCKLKYICSVFTRRASYKLLLPQIFFCGILLLETNKRSIILMFDINFFILFFQFYKHSVITNQIMFREGC